MRLPGIATLALTLTVSLAAPVVAQTPGTRFTPTMPRIDMTTRYGASAAENQDRFARALTDPTRQAGDPAAQRREALIEQVAPLVAEGRCDAARQLARTEGDRPLSRRIGQVCVEGRPTPMDAPPAE